MGVESAAGFENPVLLGAGIGLSVLPAVGFHYLGCPRHPWLNSTAGHTERNRDALRRAVQRMGPLKEFVEERVEKRLEWQRTFLRVVRQERRALQAEIRHGNCGLKGIVEGGRVSANCAFQGFTGDGVKIPPKGGPAVAFFGCPEKETLQPVRDGDTYTVSLGDVNTITSKMLREETRRCLDRVRRGERLRVVRDGQTDALRVPPDSAEDPSWPEIMKAVWAAQKEAGPVRRNPVLAQRTKRNHAGRLR